MLTIYNTKRFYLSKINIYKLVYRSDIQPVMTETVEIDQDKNKFLLPLLLLQCYTLKSLFLKPQCFKVISCQYWVSTATVALLFNCHISLNEVWSIRFFGLYIPSLLACDELKWSDMVHEDLYSQPNLFMIEA